ncbi:MAG: ATP-dependent helicase [Candidatus Nomurabacteria bacterium]|nr:ATP-dependent helicase [Candidatus Nomurabacteria bacterium]USN87647.1 MAG: ATP-dependent helicase [Candidatus Nomurabacteria bacterium]
MTDILEKIKQSDKKLFVGLAGPGTGKSFTFGTIIKSEEYKGKKILILSFINKLIDDLSEEFNDFPNVDVSTLHAFARSILVKEEDCDLDEDLDKYISEDYSFIHGSKINYEKKFHDNDLTDNEKEFYKQRKEFYSSNGKLYSFNSVVYAANLLFQQNESKIPTYDLILVDEFQDFNKSEYELIKFLNKQSTVILVGDDDQSLYHFKQAKPSQIRSLYNDGDTEGFSLDYCYRCPKVIIETTNDLIRNAKTNGCLDERLEKEFLYPEGHKDEESKKYAQITFVPSVIGNQLAYRLSKMIEEDLEEYKDKQRVLILTPSYLKQTVYEGLMKKGFTVVGVELFSNEERNKIKHRKLCEVFEILLKRKTDNLALRKILPLYLDETKRKEVINESNEKQKKIWNCLDDGIKGKIEEDINIFKKVKTGKKELSKTELERFSKIFNLKNILTKIVRGFESNKKDAIEVELTTVTSSKGLSADFVYYVGIDDEHILDKDTKKFTDHKICEFLVGITRAKKKLTLISLKDASPKILNLVGKEKILKKN